MSEQRELALFAFVDALGWRIFQENRFLQDRLQTASPLQSILGYSCACDPTILSGQLPQAHGHFSFFAYDPDNSPFRACRWLRFLPRTITKRGRVRRLISKAIQRFNGYTGYFQIYNVPFDRIDKFDYTEKRDLYQPDGLNSGLPTIFDYLRKKEIPFCMSDWRRDERHNIEEMKNRIREAEVRFAYLYLAELDGVIHSEGTRSPRVREKIEWYDEQFRALLTLAEQHYDRVRFYLFSDHGMTDVVRNYDLISEIESMGLRFGVDYAAVYDSTMARFWTLNDSAKRQIIQQLEKLEYGRLLSKSDLQQFGVDFDDARYGELFFLLHAGGLITPSYMNESHVPGMHGYDPGHPDSVALFASTESLEDVPYRLDDLYPLMLREADACSGEPDLAMPKTEPRPPELHAVPVDHGV